MALFPEKDEFKPTARMLEQSDPVNANLFNAIYQVLLNNDNFLKKSNEEINLTLDELIDKREIINVTISTTWSGINPFIQEISVPRLIDSENTKYLIDPVLSDDSTKYEEQMKAWNCISKIKVLDNKIIVRCNKKKPASAIEVIIKELI